MSTGKGFYIHLRLSRSEVANMGNWMGQFADTATRS